jgi:hypothetical protein
MHRHSVAPVPHLQAHSAAAGTALQAALSAVRKCRRAPARAASSDPRFPKHCNSICDIGVPHQRACCKAWRGGDRRCSCLDQNPSEIQTQWCVQWQSKQSCRDQRAGEVLPVAPAMAAAPLLKRTSRPGSAGSSQGIILRPIAMMRPPVVSSTASFPWAGQPCQADIAHPQPSPASLITTAAPYTVNHSLV